MNNRFHFFIEYCQGMVSYDKCDICSDWLTPHWEPFKFSGIRYSKRMLQLDSAVSIHLIKIAQLALKFKSIIVKSNLPAFNYAVPDPERWQF